MFTRRVTGILAWGTLAVGLGWPSYELLTGMQSDDPQDGFVAAAVSTFPETIPLEFRTVGDQTIRTEQAEVTPVEESELEVVPDTELAIVAAPIPRPAIARPAPPVLDQRPDVTALGYVSPETENWDTGPIEDFFEDGGRPLSANPYFEAPRGSSASSGDYLLDERYGGADFSTADQEGFFLDDYEGGDFGHDPDRPGFYLDEYERGSNRSNVTFNLGN